MAKPAGMTLTGDKELERLLRKLPDKVQKRVIPAAVTFAAKRPLREYKAKVKAAGIKFPTAAIGAKHKTYRRTGIRVATIGAKKGFYIGEPTEKEPLGQSLAKVLTVWEYGWRDTPPTEQRKKKWVKRGQGSASRPPRPMLRPVYLAAQSYILGEFQRGIGRAIEKEAAKLAKKLGILK